MAEIEDLDALEATPEEIEAAKEDRTSDGRLNWSRRSTLLRWRAFADEYLSNGFNAAEAARAIGCRGKASQTGWRLLNYPEVRAYIQKKFEERSMQANEVLARLADHAQGSMGDFVSEDFDGEPRLDLKKAREAGKLHLIKRLRVQANGAFDIELYDQQNALQLIGRHLQMFVDRHELTGKDGGPISLQDARAALAAKLAAISDRRKQADELRGGGEGEAEG